MAKRILVADDSVTIQKAFAMTFAAEDVTLAFARSADEGLSVARQAQPDLVIADAVMPGRSGYDLCAALKADRALASVPVYILASAQNPFDEGRGRQVGADGHLLKPFDSSAIIDRVRDALGKAESSAGVVSSSVGGRSNYSPPSMGGIPVPPPGSDYGDDDYGEITIDTVPARDLPRPAPVAAPLPSVPAYAPAVPAPAFAAAPPAVAAPGFTARPASAPGTTAPALGPGLRPSLIPGARPGLAPAGRPGIVPAPNAPTARPLAPPPAGPAAHAPAGATPTLRPASIPTARTMVGMPVPRPGLSMPIPSPPARPGTGPVRTLSQPPPSAPVSPPAAIPTPATHVQVGTGLVDQKVAEIAARGPEYEVLAKLSREVIEKIVWEIVPELTEAIVREELQRRGRA